MLQLRIKPSVLLYDSCKLLWPSVGSSFESMFALRKVYCFFEDIIKPFVLCLAVALSRRGHLSEKCKNCVIFIVPRLIRLTWWCRRSRNCKPYQQSSCFRDSCGWRSCSDSIYAASCYGGITYGGSSCFRRSWGEKSSCIWYMSCRGVLSVGKRTLRMCNGEQAMWLSWKRTERCWSKYLRSPSRIPTQYLAKDSANLKSLWP